MVFCIFYTSLFQEHVVTELLEVTAAFFRLYIAGADTIRVPDVERQGPGAQSPLEDIEGEQPGDTAEEKDVRKLTCSFIGLNFINTSPFRGLNINSESFPPLFATQNDVFNAHYRTSSNFFLEGPVLSLSRV